MSSESEPVPYKFCESQFMLNSRLEFRVSHCSAYVTPARITFGNKGTTSPSSSFLQEKSNPRVRINKKKRIMSTFQWLCQDSNLDQKFRKLPFYPLNYRALIQDEYK